MEELTDLIKLSSDYSSVEFKANQIVEGFLTGLHRSPFHGFSVEFADYRAYNSGESTKFIDWKLFARTDKLFVKNYDQETNLRALLCLDCTRSMHFPFSQEKKKANKLNKFVFSVYASSVIISLLYKQRDAFGLSFLSDKIEQLTQIKSSYIHKRYLFNILEQMLAKQNKEFGKADDISIHLHQISETIHKRSLVIIFTDLMTNNQDSQIISALEHLKHNKHEVILFHVMDKSLEQDLEFSNRPYKFIDSETNQICKLNPIEIKEFYANNMHKRFETIHNLCNNLSIDYVACDIEKGFNQILMPYFYKRMKLY